MPGTLLLMYEAPPLLSPTGPATGKGEGGGGSPAVMSRAATRTFEQDTYQRKVSCPPLPLKSANCGTGGGEETNERKFHFWVELRF